MTSAITAGSMPLPDDAPMTLDEAAEVLLRGAVTAATLRAAIGRHDLACERIGRRIMVTPADIKAWRTRCRVPAQDRPSGTPLHGSISLAPFTPAHVETQRALARTVFADLAKVKPRAERRRRDAQLQKDRG